MNARIARISASGSLLVVLTLASCGSDSSSDAASCDELANSARADLVKAIASHASCTTNADCDQIDLAASCFDSCSRPMNKAGEADLTAARNRVDEGSCKRFTAQGCKVTIPPCVPPGAATCTSGTCQ